MSAAQVATLEELTTGARKTYNGKVSATDVIMVIKQCTRNNASKILRNLQEEQRIPALEMEVFGEANSDLPNSRRGGNRLPEAAADARQIVQVIWALPGDIAFRRNSADVVVRYIGGDPQMVGEILANRAAQETLAREAPSHQARIFGEAVEAENPRVLAKRTSLDLLELDVREGELKARLEASKAQLEKAQGETKRARVDTFVYCHEAARRLGVEPDDRTLLQLRDLVQSVAIPTEAQSQKEIRVRSFLLSKKANGAFNGIKLGKAVAALKREHLQGLGLSDVLPTKTIYLNGQVVQAKLYFEEDLPFFEKAWESIGAATAAPPQVAASRRRNMRP